MQYFKGSKPLFMVERTQSTLIHEQRQRYVTVVAMGVVNPLMPLVHNASWGKGSD